MVHMRKEFSFGISTFVERTAKTHSYLTPSQDDNRVLTVQGRSISLPRPRDAVAFSEGGYRGTRKGESRGRRQKDLTINKYLLMNCPMDDMAAMENKVFQALADPSRRAIFESLTRGEAAVKDLTARFDISQPAVSQHLAILRDAGLVNGRPEGRCVYYQVNPRGMRPLIDWIAYYRAFWTEHVDRLEQLLEKMD
jgi:DNA-binding transcriptional ArsR family regulator